MSYSFPKDSANGTEVTLENGVTYQYNSLKNTWGVQSVENQLLNKQYIDTAAQGNVVGSGRRFGGANSVPSPYYNYFVTDAAQPKDVKKIYLHPDFLSDYVDGPGKTFKRGGWIYIYETDSAQRTLGMYFVYNLVKDGDGNKYFSVHGLSTTNVNLIVGTNYGIGLACSFNSSMGSTTSTIVEVPSEE